MKYAIFGSHGIGDNILSLQCAKEVHKILHYVKNIKILRDNTCDVICCSRDDVFYPLKYLFEDYFNIYQHPDKAKWGEDNWILNNLEVFDDYLKLKEYDDGYYVIPDLLFHSPRCFPYEKFVSHPQTIKTTKLLTHKWDPKKIIYVGLVTSTDGYLYYDIPELLSELGKAMPEYEIYFPKVKSWAEKKELNLGNFNRPFPSNVNIDESQDFLDSLDKMMSSCYGLFTCNGPSHIAYQLGLPYTLLDPRMGIENLIWQVRWRENGEYSIPLNALVKRVVNLVKTNIEIPQTCMVPRQIIFNNPRADWKKALLFKYD